MTNLNEKPRLFLLDAYALVYRAYYAFIKRPMITSKGNNTSAIYGFTNFLFELLERQKPEYLAVVFDPPSPTFRNHMFAEYKANRLETPEDIKKSIPVIKSIITAFNMPFIEVEGFEADDVIGTLAKQAEKQGLLTFMVTSDKDYTQLVSDTIFIYKPSRGGNDFEIIGIPEVLKTFRIDNPIQVIDILALWGDSTDNIPGAPGIGEKSAKELIAKYKTLDNLLQHVSELSGKQRDNISNNTEQILLSQKLAKICTEVPIQMNLDNLRSKKWNSEKLKEIFKELEFKSFISKLLAEIKNTPVQGSLFDTHQEIPAVKNTTLMTLDTTPHKYQLIDNEQQLDQLVDILTKIPEFCFDTETTGLNTQKAELVGLALSFKAHEAYYVPFPANRKEATAILDKLKPVFDDPNIKKIGQNLKFDLQVLMNYNVAVKGKLFDTMIAHYLIQPDLRHNMDYLAEIYLDYHPVPIEDLIGKKGDNQKNMRDVEVLLIKEYAGEDADITWQLSRMLADELQQLKLTNLAELVEMPLVRVLAEMEYAGFKIDVESLFNYSNVLKNEISTYESEIYNLANGKFNINSPKQLGEVLFEKLKIAEGVQKTKTKQYSTGEEILVKLVNKHPIVNKILEYRAMQKLLNTYVDAIPELMDKTTGKIHTSFEQAWVSTGRLSSKSPNLQNIPIREERGKEIRKSFVPKDNHHILLSADYSQIELRLMAHLSNDQNMIKAFTNGEDIHTSTAAKIFKISENNVTPEMRSRAKTANFGIIYGISSFGLSQRLNISRTDASILISGYFESYPKIKEYMDNTIKSAKEKGYVETIMGRRRYLPDINSVNAIVRGVAERNAINAPIQGSAADIIKLAMVKIQDKLRKNFETAMILQVHDELIFDVKITELSQVKDLVKYEMENAVKLSVPIIVDIGTGKNWLEAH